MEQEDSAEIFVLHRFASSPAFPAVMIAFGAIVALAESVLMLIQGESI